MPVRPRLLAAVALVILAASVSSCGRDANADERAVCNAVRRLETVKERADERQLLDTMVDRSRRSKNRVLTSNTLRFRKDVDKKDLSDGIAALGKLTDECERLGLRGTSS